MRKRTHAVLLATSACALAAATPATAAELRVDDDHAQCPTATFTSIQAAVTAASPGDTVKVCPGTYNEQVRIENKPKLKLESLTPQTATIKFPPVTMLPNVLVDITHSDDVRVRDFVISGPYTATGCDAAPATRHRGVYVDNSFGVDIRHNHITLIRSALPAVSGGCQDGLGVQIGRQAESSVGSATLTDNVIDLYQKGGVVVDNAGSSAKVDHNTITASQDFQPLLAPNGVQVGRQASGRVDHNDISQNHFSGDPTLGTGAGILLFQPLPGGVQVDHNDVFDNDDNIVLDDADREQIDHNIARDSSLDDGIFVDENSTENEILENNAFNNPVFDCEDVSHGNGTAGTANEWKDDRGIKANPPGICRP